jgi:multidrug efflux pump subunit AcrA (membrane-fusion protein)
LAFAIVLRRSSGALWKFDRLILCSVKIALYRYLVTLIAVAIAATTAWFLYRKYVTDPWTRDSQIRANIVGIAPRVAGPIISIPVHDNQEVKAGDLLFEIDPADYKTASDSAKASVANLEANLLQKRQDLDREAELFRRNDLSGLTMTNGGGSRLSYKFTTSRRGSECYPFSSFIPDKPNVIGCCE